MPPGHLHVGMTSIQNGGYFCNYFRSDTQIDPNVLLTLSHTLSHTCSYVVITCSYVVIQPKIIIIVNIVVVVVKFPLKPIEEDYVNIFSTTC